MHFFWNQSSSIQGQQPRLLCKHLYVRPMMALTSCSYHIISRVSRYLSRPQIFLTQTAMRLRSFLSRPYHTALFSQSHPCSSRVMARAPVNINHLSQHVFIVIEQVNFLLSAVIGIRNSIPPLSKQEGTSSRGMHLTPSSIQVRFALDVVAAQAH